MIGDFALADQVLGAGDLVGKDRRNQVLGVHAHELRRHLPAAAEARQRQRHAGDPAPAGDEHRRIEQRLDQQRPDAGRMQVARYLAELEAMGGGQREDDVVLGRGGLQLEVERAAEALAQRQPPRPVDAAAVGRMDDQLHAADLVEEALEDERVLGRQAAQRRMRRRRGIRQAVLRRARRCRRPPSSQRAALFAGRVGRHAKATSARRRATACDSSLLRPGASPSQKGMLGAMPCASATRTVPRSTRRMR